MLFFGQHELVRVFLEGIEAAPAGAGPLEVVAAAVQSAAVFFADERRPISRIRQTVIEQNPALQEREQHKLGALGEVDRAEAAGPRGRRAGGDVGGGVGITVFGVAFAQWIAEGEERSFATIAAEVFRELVTLTGSASSL